MVNNVNDNQNDNQNVNVNTASEAQQAQVINLLTRIAESTVEPQDLVAAMCMQLTEAQLSDGTQFDDIDRLRVSAAAETIGKKLKDTYKQGAKDEFLRLYGSTPGDRQHHNGNVRFYETTSYTWENVHIEDAGLQERNALYHDITAAEEALKIMKAKLKGYDEALAVRFPKSEAIHKKAVISIL